MMSDPANCERYFELLKAHVAAPREEHLLTAAEMGTELALAGVSAADVVQIHQEALQRLAEESPEMKLRDVVCRVSQPLADMFKTFGVDSCERGEFERQAELAEARYQAERERDLREIAEQKRMKEQLLHAAEEWRTTFDSVTDLISIHDRDFRLVRVNKAFANALEAHPKDLIGKLCYEVVHCGTGPIKDCPHKRVLETQRPARQEYFEPRLGVHIEASLSPIFDQEGKLIGSVHVARDITERKRVEELWRSQEITWAVVDQSPDGVLIVDTEGVVKYVNPAAETLLQRKEQELLSSMVGLPLATDAVTELDIVRGDGETGIAEMRVRKTVWEGAAAYLVSLHDISGHKQLEEELARAKDAAEAADRAKSEFLANMSHELRTPLNAIIGFSEGLLERADRHPLNNHQKDRIAKTLQSGRHLLGLINDVLDIAKVEAGQAEFHVTTFAVHPLAEEIAGLAQELLRAKGDVTFSLDLADEGLQLTSDRDKVKQILLNLVGNAAKFTDQGSVTLRIQHCDGCLNMVVVDTGIGIPEDQFYGIFEKFRQVHTTARPSVGGTGLGLSIAKSLAEVLGGKLTVESMQGRGSEFTLMLPVAVDDAAARMQEGAAVRARRI